MRSDNSPFVLGYPPFLGSCAYGRSGVTRETRGRRAGWVPESGRTDLVIPEEAGVLARKVPYAQKVLPARKARVHGRTCRRGKGVLRGRDCRRYGNIFVRDRDLDDDYCD